MQGRGRSSESTAEQARSQPQDPKRSSKEDTRWLSCLSAGQAPAQVPHKQQDAGPCYTDVYNSGDEQ